MWGGRGWGRNDDDAVDAVVDVEEEDEGEDGEDRRVSARTSHLLQSL